MSIAQWIMVCGIVAFAGLIYYMLNREKVDAWFTRVRSTNGAQAAIAEVSSIEAAVLRRIRQQESAARIDRTFDDAAALVRESRQTDPAVPASVADTSPPSVAPNTPVAAPSGNGGTVQLKAKESIMATDKGVASAGELLSGWVLANYETKTDPVPAKRHADLMYLTQMARKPGGNQVFEDVLLGSQAEINVARNYAHTNGWDPLVTYAPDGGFKDWGAEADPAVKQAAEASIAAYQAAHPRNVHTYDFSRYLPKA